MILRGWISLTGVVLVLSTTVHVSTFFNFDPQHRIPGLMFLHGVVLVLFFVAMFYIDGRKGDDVIGDLFNAAPRWLRRLFKILFVYAFINFFAFMYLGEMSKARDEGNGSYALKKSEILIRKLTREEFHRWHAYEARFFSGHWMIFSCAELVLMVGRDRRRSQPTVVEATVANEST